jgi:alpha-tubulin suppressor-like RCC1 family protein
MEITMTRSPLVRTVLLVGLAAISAGAQSATPLVAISAGPSTSFALRADLTVRVFGDGAPSGLAIPGVLVTTGPRTLPGLAGVVELESGAGHLVARLVDGTVWTVGSNAVLGVPVPAGGTSAAVQVPGVASTVDVAAGLVHSLALRADGSVLGWGSNGSGQIGIAPGTITVASPVVIPGLAGVTAVAAGDFFSMALMADGTVRTWGLNATGQLGLGVSGGNVPTPTIIPGLTGVSKIGAGGAVAWAVLADGTVRVWGSNLFGQVGGAPSVTVPAPTPVPGVTNVQKVVSGGLHLVALRADGSLVAWGSNVLGLLGIPGAATTPQPPTLVPLPSAAQDIAAGQLHTLALLASGELWAWGQSGLPLSSAAPAPVPAVDRDATTDYLGFPCPPAGPGNAVLTCYEVPYVGNPSFALQVQKGNTLGGTAWLFFSPSVASPSVPTTADGCALQLDPTGLMQFIAAGLSPLGPYALSNGVPSQSVPLPIPQLSQLAGTSITFQVAMLPLASQNFLLTNAVMVTVF